MSATDDGNDLTTHDEPFVHNGPTGNTSLPPDLTHGSPTRRQLNPYLAFLTESLDESDSAYERISQFYTEHEVFRLPDRGIHPFASECFDFCTTSSNEPARLQTSSFSGSIKDHMSARPPVSGTTRVIITRVYEVFDPYGLNLKRLMDDVGFFFKLPPYVFAPFIGRGSQHEPRVEVLHDAYTYTEALVFSAGNYAPVVIQPVTFPGSEAADTTCRESAP